MHPETSVILFRQVWRFLSVNENQGILMLLLLSIEDKELGICHQLLGKNFEEQGSKECLRKKEE